MRSRWELVDESWSKVAVVVVVIVVVVVAAAVVVVVVVVVVEVEVVIEVVIDESESERRGEERRRSDDETGRQGPREERLGASSPVSRSESASSRLESQMWPGAGMV